MTKVILKTIAGTLVTIIFLAYLFLNGILGIFGYISTPIESYNNFRSSKQIVNEMKERHKKRKLGVSKRFVRRSSRKISASAISAVTIGTAGVVLTVAGLEVYDYCEDKSDMLDEENILFGTEIEFNYNKCLSDAKGDSDKIIASVKRAVPEMVGAAWDDTKDISHDVWESTKQTSADAWKSTSESTEQIWQSLNGWITGSDK